MQQRFRVLSILADGQFHSGEELGSTLGIGRSAVWKLVQSLEMFGLDIYAVRGKGYRLASPLELLEQERIVAEMAAETRGFLGGLEIFQEIDSTNRYLMDQSLQIHLPNGYACFAEYQSAGRGRRGRNWVSPFGANVYLSLYRCFDGVPGALQGLSLAVGVAAVEALASLGVPGIGLKWPNDLLWQGRKLGGILLEMAGESAGPWKVVVGVGLNLEIPAASGRLIEQPWVDLKTIAGSCLGRNLVAGRLLQYLLTGLELFADSGFTAFREAFAQRDITRDQTVVIRDRDTEIQGIARGVDDTGTLLVSVENETRRIMVGDISLRVRP
jgi:BirA family biotin operon repressor/biotin-[acetyl-CoA-carboxylase] ligase